MAKLKEAAKARMLATLKQNAPDATATQKIAQRDDDRDSRSAAGQAAALFNTNRTYIREAEKLKNENPEAFTAVKSGEATLQEVKREVQRPPAKCR